MWTINARHPIKFIFINNLWNFCGGGGGIRTHGRLSPTSVFKTGAFNHSATPPTTMEVLGFYDVIKRLSEKKFTALKVGYLTL